MFRSVLFFSIYLIFSHFAQAQIKGLVQGKDSQGKTEALVGATVVWKGTQVVATTNEAGEFEIPVQPNNTALVVSFVGFKTDTVQVQNAFITVTLAPDNTLKEVVLRNTDNLDKATTKSELLGVKELRKAACCNLSESFETNASVDVSTTDAVSGTKQIRLLGLDGTYAQIMAENMPFVRGLASRSGLYFIPGTWIKSIDINKGAGSVVNGYESITGQINVELAKPENSEKLLLNFYANNGTRLEANMNLARKVSERWHTGVLAHHSRGDMAMDNNRDGFMDNPMFEQFNIINRWKYQGDIMESQIGFKALYEDRTSGQSNFRHATGQTHDFSTPYGANFRTTRLEGFTKTGFFLGEDEKGHVNQSLGIIFNYTYQDQQSLWGMNTYEGKQNSMLLNAIYQNEPRAGQTWRLGASAMSDELIEKYLEGHNGVHLPNTHPTNYFSRKRRELSTGVFAEYNFDKDKLGFVAGLRADYHNLWGFFVTPRLHFKYEFTDRTILRLSGGRGQRTANPLAENVSYMISSRKLYLPTAPLLEIGWNYGGSFSHQFFIGNTKATLTADFYRTDFQKQAITDLFTSPQAIIIHQLNGQSYANSLQIGLDYEIHEKLKARLAYKYYDIRASYNSFAGDLGLRSMPFIPQNRFFANIGYTTPNEKWEFDLTAEYFGRQVLPTTASNPVEFQRPDKSLAYVLVSAQVTRKLGKKWEVYLGGENIGNYRQQNPIIEVNNPYGNYFDAGQTYAPVFGAMVYTGVRFTVE